MNYFIDKPKAVKKWAPVLDSLKVTDEDKRTWMAEYAEMHQLNEIRKLPEWKNPK
jgi:hypothetical protein